MAANMTYASTNDALNKIMGIIGEAYTLNGADTQILDMLQDIIVMHFQKQATAAGQQAYSNAVGDLSQVQGQGGPSPTQSVNYPPPRGAGMMGVGSPNPDELRRVLAGTQANG